MKKKSYLVDRINAVPAIPKNVNVVFTNASEYTPVEAMPSASPPAPVTPPPPGFDDLDRFHPDARKTRESDETATAGVAGETPTPDFGEHPDSSSPSTSIGEGGEINSDFGEQPDSSSTPEFGEINPGFGQEQQHPNFGDDGTPHSGSARASGSPRTTTMTPPPPPGSAPDPYSKTEARSPEVVARMPPEIPEHGAIAKTFETTRRALLNQPWDQTDLDLAMQRMQTRSMDADLESYQAPFKVAVPQMANFLKYYGSLKDDESGTDVLDVELRKRRTLYQAVQTILSSGVPPAIVHLLFVLGAKTFVVAFYTVSQGFRYDTLLQRSIFQVRPGVGANVSDVFEDHLQTLLGKGGELLQLDPAFLAAIHGDHVSYDELSSLLTGC